MLLTATVLWKRVTTMVIQMSSALRCFGGASVVGLRLLFFCLLHMGCSSGTRKDLHTSIIDNTIENEAGNLGHAETSLSIVLVTLWCFWQCTGSTVDRRCCG